MKKVLSFDGWSVGIAYFSKLVLDSIFSLLVIHKAKKNNIKLLYFPAISMIFAVIAFSPLLSDFVYIILTGNNIPISNLYFIIFSVFLQFDGFAYSYLGISLTFTSKRKLTLIFILVYGIFFTVVQFFLPDFGFSLFYPESPGENLIKPFFSFSSIAFYLLIPYTVLDLGYYLLLFLKSRKLKGKIRTKFQVLGLGYIIGFFWLFLVFTTQNVGFLYAILFVASIILIWATFYYGLTPVKEKKPKVKRGPTEVQQKFVSYLMKKKSDNQINENGISIPDNNILIFVSYSTKDSKIYKIQDIAEQLKSYSGIKDVLFYEGESIDNIIKYMNDNLGQCDAFLLFCSENALCSVPVEKEWTAAEAMGVPIIPIFYDLKHIPPLLQSRLGGEYDFYNLDQTVREIYISIVKKCMERD